MPDSAIFLGLGEAQQYIAVVIQNLGGPGYLVLTSLRPHSDATERLLRVQHEYEEALKKVRTCRWRSFFTKYNIGIANVQLVSGDNYKHHFVHIPSDDNMFRSSQLKQNQPTRTLIPWYSYQDSPTATFYVIAGKIPPSLDTIEA